MISGKLFLSTQVIEDWQLRTEDQTSKLGIELGTKSRTKLRTESREAAPSIEKSATDSRMAS